MVSRTFETIVVKYDEGRCYVMLNRPKARNALSNQMVGELLTLLEALSTDTHTRILIMRGAEGWFCAGGDIKAFQSVFQGTLTHAECSAENRKIGTLLTQINELPQTVIMLVEGAAIGGGFGLVCTSDIAIATVDARFSLTETTLGLPPAQIAAFVVQRIGFTQARRLTLTGARFRADEAAQLGLIHFVVPDAAALAQKADEIVAQVERCGPQANAVTKEILHSTQRHAIPAVLDNAAQRFATAMLSDEGREGIAAFVEKRQAIWKK